MTGILIIGAGGHAKVIADILLSQGVTVLGFVDDDPATWGSNRLGRPVLGNIDACIELEPDGLVIGIGSNVSRRTMVQRLGQWGERLWYNAIHPAATVAESVRMGRGVVVAAHAVINPDTVIGSHVIINTGATVDHDCHIGAYSHIAPGTHLAGGVTVGEGTLVGIGTNVIPNCSVGNWTTVGAGSLVINDVPDEIIAKGIPARWDDQSTK